MPICFNAFWAIKFTIKHARAVAETVLAYSSILASRMKFQTELLSFTEFYTPTNALLYTIKY